MAVVEESFAPFFQVDERWQGICGALIANFDTPLGKENIIDLKDKSELQVSSNLATSPWLKRGSTTDFQWLSASSFRIFLTNDADYSIKYLKTVK